MRSFPVDFCGGGVGVGGVSDLGRAFLVDFMVVDSFVYYDLNIHL